VFIRQWATNHQVPNAESLGAPSLDSDPADPTWTAEVAIGTEDSSMAFGRRELHPHPLGKFIKVSRTLLRKVPEVEGLVRSRLGYKFAVTMENAYLSGSGANQPLGVFVASDNGISTSRDVSEGNTTTELRFDGLIEAKFTLKQQYWPRAKWLFHRDGVKQIAKLKDGEEQYIWRESVRVGEPDRILGMPCFMSEYVPNTFTSNLYVGILADFSFYWTADALDMEIQRLVELYAATNQVGFIGRMESDGMPVLEEAFVRVKLA
jgi:HK97 family phage major capsid protein